MASNTVLKTLSSKNLTDNKPDWKLLYFSLKIINIERTFGDGEKEFDFKHFYDEF
jgi:hypothetical protein